MRLQGLRPGHVPLLALLATPLGSPSPETGDYSGCGSHHCPLFIICYLGQKTTSNI